MKLGLKALVIALVMGLAAVPAVSASNGHGGGKPSWAGGGKPSSAGTGRPSWAGSGHAGTTGHHEQKPKKSKSDGTTAQQGDSTTDSGTQSAGADLSGLNPAWYCKTLLDEMNQIQSDFAAVFGTNPNGANAFGQCVSRRAHGEDLSGAVGGGDQQDQQSQPAPCDTTEPPATDTGSDGTGTGSDGTDTGADGTGTGTDGTGTDATVPDPGTTDASSDDEAAEPENCNDDSASDAPAAGQDQTGDDGQGEDTQGDGGNASDGADSSDLTTALRFIRL